MKTITFKQLREIEKENWKYGKNLSVDLQSANHIADNKEREKKVSFIENQITRNNAQANLLNQLITMTLEGIK